MTADPVAVALAAVRARHDDEDEFRKDVEEDRDMMLLDTAAAVEAAAPLIAATERQRILAEDPAAGVYRLGCRDGAASERGRLAAVIPPERFRLLADWFDADDELKRGVYWPSEPRGHLGEDVQKALREFADLLEADVDDPVSGIQQLVQIGRAAERQLIRELAEQVEASYIGEENETGDWDRFPFAALLEGDVP